MSEETLNPNIEKSTPTGVGLKDISQALSHSEVDLSPTPNSRKESKVGRVWGKNQSKIPKRSQTEGSESVDIKIIKADIKDIKKTLEEAKRVKKFKGTKINGHPSTQKRDNLLMKFLQGVDAHLDPISADIVDAGKWLFKRSATKVSPKEANVKAKELKGKVNKTSAAGDGTLLEVKDRLVKLDVRLEDDNAQINKKLDEILKKTEAMDGGGILDSLIGAIPGLLTTALAGISSMLKSVWSAVKSIGEFLKIGISKAGNLVKKGAQAAGRGVSKGAQAAGAATKRVLGKTGTAAGKLLSKVSPIARVIGKAAGPAGAALDVGFGAYDLAKGKTKEKMKGLDYISPMSYGMYAGDKVNKVVEKTTGSSIGGGIYDLFHRNEKWQRPIPTPRARTRPNVQPLPPPVTKKLAEVVKENQQLQVAPVSTKVMQPIVVNKKEKVKYIPSPSSNRTPIVRTRNDESSLSSTVHSIFDAPQGYNTLSRL